MESQIEGRSPESSVESITSVATFKPLPDKLYFRIGDVAELLNVKAYVLRYWETEFPMVSPTKSQAGHRVYRRQDVELLQVIQHLLYNERYSIEGARKRIRDLKRAGELKKFKETEAAVANPAPAVEVEAVQTVSAETIERMNRARSLAQELRVLSQVTVDAWFTDSSSANN